MNLITRIKLVWLAMRMTDQPEWVDMVVLFRLVSLMPTEDPTLLIILAALHLYELDWLYVHQMVDDLRLISRFYTTTTVQNGLVRLSYQYSDVLVGINDPAEVQWYGQYLMVLCHQILSADQTPPTVQVSLDSVLERAFAVPYNHGVTHPVLSEEQLIALVQRQLSSRGSTSRAQTNQAPDSATPPNPSNDTLRTLHPNRAGARTARPGIRAAVQGLSRLAQWRRSSRALPYAGIVRHPPADADAGSRRSLHCKRSRDSDTDECAARKRPATATAVGR